MLIRLLPIAPALLLSVLLATGLTVATAEPVPVSQTPPGCASVSVVLFNPAPGDLVAPGPLVIQGKAIDTTAPQAPGVDRVQVYFDQPRGDRRAQFGGELDADSLSGMQRLDPSGGFEMSVSVPRTSAHDNTHAVYVYARSAVTGQEAVINYPIQIGKPLSEVLGHTTPTPTPPPETVLSLPTCTTPPPTKPPIPSGLLGPNTASTDTLTLSVFNPQSGDTIGAGDYAMSGVAFDSAAQSGAGIDSIQAFLDPRDQGGQYLGSASMGGSGGSGAGGIYGFQLTAALPDHPTGPHTLSIYAMSSVNGHETVVTIPISVE